MRRRLLLAVAALIPLGAAARTCFDFLYYFGNTEWRFRTAAEVNRTSLSVLLPRTATDIVVVDDMDTGEEWSRFRFVAGDVSGALPDCAIQVTPEAIQLPTRSAPHWWWDDWWPDDKLKDALRAGTLKHVRFYRWRYRYMDDDRLAQAMLELETGTAYLWTDSVREPWLADPWLPTSTVAAPFD